MKKRNKLFCAALAALMLLTACSGRAGSAPQKEAGEIVLYGEAHGVEAILEKELELWKDCYHTKGMRHLFVELPYFTAAYLNLWMEQEDDAILTAVYGDWIGTSIHVPAVRDFYAAIKEQCPETVFHGTDVGHQYDTTGKRFLHNLEKNGQADTEPYRLTLEAIQQGKTYYQKQDDAYRENAMVENFIREYDALEGESVMGIYGAAHTTLEGAAWGTEDTPTMASQLQGIYGEALRTEDISWIAKEDIQPLRVDTLTVGGKTYQASYFGEESISDWSIYLSRAFWRLEDAYGDFQDAPEAGDVLPYDNYPMLLETGQVFVVDYTGRDGAVERFYYRSDGTQWQGRPTTVAFVVE